MADLKAQVEELRGYGAREFRRGGAVSARVCSLFPDLARHYLELLAENERLRADTWCDVCCGTGKAASDKPCLMWRHRAECGRLG